MMALLLFLVPQAWTASPDTLTLAPGYIYKIRCEGRLLVSAIGNESLFALEALPADLGCAVLLRPKAKQGSTNIVLETTAGTVQRVLVIGTVPRTAGPFEISVRADAL